MSYASRLSAPPRTLTDDEVKRLLDASGKHKDGFRDHVLLSVALGTGLRLSEIVALNFGDVSPDAFKGKVYRTIQLRVYKRAGEDADSADQRVHLPDGTFYKLSKYLKVTCRDHGFKPGTDHPLFEARGGGRLGERTVRDIFYRWQAAAGFDHRYNFHALRHTFITNVRRKTGDIRIAQKAARHVNIATTTRYEHASDQEVLDSIKGLRS